MRKELPDGEPGECQILRRNRCGKCRRKNANVKEFAY